MGRSQRPGELATVARGCAPPHRPPHHIATLAEQASQLRGTRSQGIAKRSPMREDVREDQIVSELLRTKAHVLPGGREVCWGGDDIEAALREIAGAGHVILGFDIVEPLPGGEIKYRGTSGYETSAYLQSKPWDECISLALEAAIKDVRDTPRLTGLKAPYSHLWYCVVSRPFASKNDNHA